jgi:hypothetical protein
MPDYYTEVAAYVANLSTTGLPSALILFFLGVAMTMRKINYQARLAYENASRLQRENAELAKQLESLKADRVIELEDVKAGHALELERIRAENGERLAAINAAHRTACDKLGAVQTSFLQFVYAVRSDRIKTANALSIEQSKRLDDVFSRLYALAYRSRNAARALFSAEMLSAELFDEYQRTASDFAALYYETSRTTSPTHALESLHTYRRIVDDIAEPVGFIRRLFENGMIPAARSHVKTVRSEHWQRLEAQFQDVRTKLAPSTEPEARAS